MVFREVEALAMVKLLGDLHGTTCVVFDSFDIAKLTMLSSDESFLWFLLIRLHSCGSQFSGVSSIRLRMQRLKCKLEKRVF